MSTSKCKACHKNPVHPDKKCCFNCGRDGNTCNVWHNCGMDCCGWEPKKQTNADRIRAMTDEELAEFICDVSKKCQDVYIGGCLRCKDPWCSSDDTVKWLQEPAKEVQT